MNIVETLQRYKEVATFLSDDANGAVLDHLIACMEGKQYYLPFIGQFSAGKSKLINRLIGKEVLPTKSVETTAFLTYISYAEEEWASLEYVDGTKESIEISRIKTLDHQHTCNGKPIAALRYAAPIELLKSGLILVDTPGVNTLINEHVKMTEELLQNSQFIVYVTASSLTDSDRRMIQNIGNLGIDMIFARTHVDEMRDSEEDVYSTIKQEQELLQQVIGTTPDYFALCNEQNSPEFDRWVSQYEGFKEYISQCLAAKIEEIYTRSTLGRLGIMKEKFEKALNTKLEFLKKNAEKSEVEIEETIAQLTAQRKSIDTKLNTQANRIKTSNDSTQSLLQSELQVQKNKQIKAFGHEVDGKTADNDLQNSVKRLFERQLPKAVDALNSYAATSIEAWKQSIIATAQGEINEVELSLQALNIDMDTNFDDTSIEALEQQAEANQSDLAEKYYQLKTLNAGSEQELEKYGIEKQEIAQMLQQYEEVIAQGNQEIKAAMDNYVPQYVQKGGAIGNVIKKIGHATDVAMLLIPATGWAKAGALLSKHAMLLSKGGKIAQAGSTVLKGLSEGTKVLATTDSTLDMTKLINYAKGSDSSQQPEQPTVGGQDKKKKGGIFDKLSVSYWLGKVADFVDPTTYVEDEQHKAEYKRLVNNMQAQLDLKVQQKVAMLSRMHRITDAEESKKLEIQQRLEAEETMRRELEQEQIKLELQRKQCICAKIADETKQQFEEKLTDYTQILTNRSKEEMDRITFFVAEGMRSFVNTQIEQVETELNETLNKRRNSTFDSNKEQEVILENITKLTIPNE